VIANETELERLRRENEEYRTSNAKLRDYFKEANVRSIINTRHVQIYREIEAIIGHVRNLEMIPIEGINSIDELLQNIDKEATPHG